MVALVHTIKIIVNNDKLNTTLLIVDFIVNIESLAQNQVFMLVF
jgi:hypothetical protein